MGIKEVVKKVKDAVAEAPPVEAPPDGPPAPAPAPVEKVVPLSAVVKVNVDCAISGHSFKAGEKYEVLTQMAEGLIAAGWATKE